MWVDGSQLQESDIQTDLCIVGSGPAGLTIARHIGDRCDVWLLEGGPEADGPDSQRAYRGRSVGLPYFDLDACRTRRFGGSSHSWGGFCRPFDALDFDERPRIPHSGWPLSHSEIAPFLAGAHQICGLGPMNYEYDFWAGPTGQGPSPFSGSNVVPEIRQKSAFDPAVARRELSASANVRVCVNAHVTSINLDEHGRAVTSVVFRGPGGRRHTIRARRFVLACGGLENARLLLASNDVQKRGVGNDHDLVGRFFMDHVDFDTGWFHPRDPALFRDQLRWRRAGTIVRNSLAIAEPIRRREQLLRCFFHVGDRPVSRTYGYRSAMHVLSELRRGRRPHNFRYHWRNMVWDRTALLAAARWRLGLLDQDPGAAGRPGVLRLQVTAEPSPNPDSRVTLDTARDRFDLPRLRLDWRINRADYEHVQRSLALFADDVRQLGLGEIRQRPASEWPTRGTYHHIGTTRMHDDPTRGVVDANGRVHGLSNLYIAGSSVFPTAGSGTPTLMLVALALRQSQHLAQQLGQHSSFRLPIAADRHVHVV